MSQVSWDVQTLKKRPAAAQSRRFNSAVFHQRLFDLAAKYYGITEIKGSNHHDQILEFHAATWLKAPDDETPWCAAFMSFIVNKVCDEMDLPHLKHDTPRALEWQDWGTSVPTRDCRKGDIVVLTRKGGGHVALATGMQNNGHCALLGGNQNNMVCTSNYPASRIVTVRRAV